MKASEWLFSTRWVEAFEEDNPAGAVYRPDDTEVPLSRRPRKRFELRRDGSASLFTPGPDDRLVEEAARWSLEDGDIVVRAKGATRSSESRSAPRSASL